MKWEMEILSPSSSYLSYSSSWILEDSKSTKWIPTKNKAFENALALYDKDTSDRWEKVAGMVPGKTVVDVIRQYKELEDDVSSIEAGLMDMHVPIYTAYSSSPSPPPFTLNWGKSRGFDVQRQKWKSKSMVESKRKIGDGQAMLLEFDGYDIGFIYRDHGRRRFLDWRWSLKPQNTHQLPWLGS